MEGRGEYSEKKKGIIGTVVFHTIALILLIFLGFFTPLPLPGEEGILVNFGDTENGLGDREPSSARKQKQTPPPPKREEKKVTPPPVKTTPPPPVSKPKPQPAEEVAMTQDYENTVAINAANEKKKEEEKKRREELDKKRKRDQQELKDKQVKEAEQDRLAKIERERLEEIERVKQEAAEQKAREEEAERQRKAEEQRKINDINSRTAGAFSKGGSGTGGTGSSEGKSQGVSFPGGNQGVPTGDPNANKYGPGGSGNGNQGSGVSFSLSGRSANSLPKPKYPGNDEGTVVVTVTVDKYGNVTKAEPGARGTNISDVRYLNEAKQAALKAKFNVDNSAPAFQQGTISYRFILD